MKLLEGEAMVITQKEGHIATIMINRPEKLNSLNQELVSALTRAIQEVNREKEIQIVVITAAGERAFIGGVDLHVFINLDPAAAEQFITDLHRCFLCIRESEKLFIASINGHTLGGGLELAASCDLRISSETAKFGMPEVKVGVPSVIEAAYLPRLIGLGRAAELIYTGKIIDAVEAERIGLVNKIVAGAKLKDETRKYAEKILENGPTALVLQKKLIAGWMALSFNASIEAGIKYFREVFKTADPSEGARAFLERRKPAYATQSKIRFGGK